MFRAAWLHASRFHVLRASSEISNDSDEFTRHRQQLMAVRAVKNRQGFCGLCVARIAIRSLRSVDDRMRSVPDCASCC